MKRANRVWIAIVAVALAVVPAAGEAAKRSGLSSRQLAYEGYVIAWHKGEGVPDGTSSQHGLHMEKVQVTPPDERRFAALTIGGAEGQPLESLSLVLKGVCDAGLKFWLERVDKTTDYWECLPEGESIEATTVRAFEPRGDWLHVRFLDVDRSIINRIWLVYELPWYEVALVHVDDIEINGQVLGGPSGSK